MSLTVNIPATITVTLEDGRAVALSEEQISCVWSFTERGDFGVFINLLKFLAELDSVKPGDPAVRVAVLERALRRVRQGYCNILEVRKLPSEKWGGRDGYGGRYGALLREEIEGVIGEIDAALQPQRAPSSTPGDDRKSCTGEHRLEDDRTGGNALPDQPMSESSKERQNKEQAKQP